MDAVIEFLKFLAFFALEFFVLVVMAAVLLIGLYRVVRDRVRAWHGGAEAETGDRRSIRDVF